MLLKVFRLLLVVLFFGAGIYVAVNNNHDLLVNLPGLAQPLATKVSFMLFVAFSAGVFVSILFFGYEWFKKSLDLRKLRRQLHSIKPTRQSLSEMSPKLTDPTVDPVGQKNSFPP